jgi:chromosome segregation ATPase
VEGSLKTVANGTLLVDSVLFGRKSYAVGTEAVVLWLQKPKPIVTGFTVRTRDGSMMLVKEPAFKDGALILNGSPFHNYRIPLTELVQLQHGNAADVVTLAWKRFDQAKPEEKNIFLAREANLDRMRDLRAQISIKQSDLKLAIAKTQLVDKKRGDIGAANEAVLRENSRLTQEWNKQYAEYVRAKSIVRSKSNQLRHKQAAVRRIRAEIDHWKEQTKKKSHRLEEAEKALTQADEKELKSAKGRRDAAKRQVDLSNRQVQRLEQRLQAEQQKLETFQKTIQNSKAQEHLAKAVVNATHRGKEDAKNKQRKGMDALRAANREYFSLLSERNRLQSDFNRRDTNKDGKLTLEELKNK